jgi:hypothetical protein
MMRGLSNILPEEAGMAEDNQREGALKKSKIRKISGILVTVVLLVLFFCSPIFPLVRSLAVMGVYDAIHDRNSLMRQENISLHIPGGLATSQTDWYPFVMTYVADQAYEVYSGEPGSKLTILYNFPAFSMQAGCSRLYDAKSPYYNSFYGAYLVRDDSNTALAEGLGAAEEAARIAQFDFFRLVLRDFGLAPSAQVFEFQVTEEEEDVSFLGYDGWVRLIADLTVNGCAHERGEFVTSYLQYGAPGFSLEGEAFAPVAMKGLIYARYFPEWDAGVYFYVMGGEDIYLEGEKLLQGSVLTKE